MLMPDVKVRRSPKLGTSDYAALAAFRRTLREFLRFSENAAREARLTSRQYQAMLILRGRGDRTCASIDELAQELLIKHNSAVGLVDRLVRQGLVVRDRAADDRRRAELRLTTRGRHVVARIAVLNRIELGRISPTLRRFFAQVRAARSAR
jgi:DNA-binding MarR family transcriptional regulator